MHGRLKCVGLGRSDTNAGFVKLILHLPATVVISKLQSLLLSFSTAGKFGKCMFCLFFVFVSETLAQYDSESVLGFVVLLARIDPVSSSVPTAA